MYRYIEQDPGVLAGSCGCGVLTAEARVELDSMLGLER
jgi:hypothetical protein